MVQSVSRRPRSAYSTPACPAPPSHVVAARPPHSSKESTTHEDGRRPSVRPASINNLYGRTDGRQGGRTGREEVGKLKRRTAAVGMRRRMSTSGTSRQTPYDQPTDGPGAQTRIDTDSRAGRSLQATARPGRTSPCPAPSRTDPSKYRHRPNPTTVRRRPKWKFSRNRGARRRPVPNRRHTCMYFGQDAPAPVASAENMFRVYALKRRPVGVTGRSVNPGNVLITTVIKYTRSTSHCQLSLHAAMMYNMFNIRYTTPTTIQ